MSEQYWVCINGKMNFITWEGWHGGDSVIDYIHHCFEEEINECNEDYEFGKMEGFKDYRITPSIVEEKEEKEEKVELINGKFIPVDEPMEVTEIMVQSIDERTFGKIHIGKIMFLEEETGNIYDPTEDKQEGWDGHNIIYNIKNLKYIKDTEWMGETYPLYKEKSKQIKFKVVAK